MAKVNGNNRLHPSPHVLSILAAAYAADYDVGDNDPGGNGFACRWVLFTGGTLVFKSAGDPDTDVTLTEANAAGKVLPIQVASVDSTSTATSITFGW